MAYNSNYSRVVYTASAGQTLFPFNFKIFYDTDIVVYNIPPGGSPERVTNGDFATDTDWIKETGWTISGGKAHATSVPQYNSLRQNSVYEIGKKYTITLAVSDFTAGILKFYRVSSGGTYGPAITANGTYQFEWTADQTDFYLYNAETSVLTCSVDNISVKEVVDASEPYSPLILNTDYTVEIIGDDGGTITLLNGAEYGAQITLYRQLEINRFFEYQPNGDLYAGVLNNDQDYQTYLIGDLREQLDSIESGGIGSESYVKRSGDTMTGKLNLQIGNSGANAIRADEVDTKIADAASGIAIDGDGNAIVKEPGGGWIENQIVAWGLFDGTQDPVEIFDSYNVTDIVKDATGQWEIEWGEAMDDIHYTVIVNTDRSEAFGSADALTVTQCRLYCRTHTDSAVNDIIGFITIGGKI